ncbi:MAG: hypothetical protein JW727_03050 [Candidatus Aenigmarchaeota archaeon]|nr:hypothetical protein [Candidatus Aenigmarchaeota archaeon]
MLAGLPEGIKVPDSQKEYFEGAEELIHYARNNGLTVETSFDTKKQEHTLGIELPSGVYGGGPRVIIRETEALYDGDGGISCVGLSGPDSAIAKFESRSQIIEKGDSRNFKNLFKSYSGPVTIETIEDGKRTISRGTLSSEGLTELLRMTARADPAHCIEPPLSVQAKLPGDRTTEERALYWNL